MFKGISTAESYEHCLSIGLCDSHLKELKGELEPRHRYELQRKAFLYIRLRILDPILFEKPYLFEKMKNIVLKSNYFTKNTSKPGTSEDKNFVDSILLLDSIVVFTLCQFCKICCTGCLFQNNHTVNVKDNPEADSIQKLLNSKSVTETDISFFNPILQDNFKGHDINFIKFCYVIALLFVRYTTVKIQLKQALTELAVDLCNVSTESITLVEIAEDALFKDKWEEAIKAYSASLKFNPYFVIGRSSRSHAYLKTRQFKKCELDSYISILVNPKHGKGYQLLSFALMEQERYLESRRIITLGLIKCKHDKDDIDCLRMVEGRMKMKKEFQEKPMTDSKQRNKLEKIKEKEKSAATNIKDVPDLEEAPDSDSEHEDPPSLSEASDSANSTPDIPDLSDASDDGTVFTPEQIQLLDNRLSQISASFAVNETKHRSILKLITNGKSELKCGSKNEMKGAKPKKEKHFERRSRSNSNCSSNEVKPNLESAKIAVETIEEKKIDKELTPEEKEKAKQEKMCKAMKEGSLALLDGCGTLAVRHFEEATEIYKNNPQVSNLGECELICIKYSFGLAYCLSGGYEDLKKSIVLFNEIIEDHKTVTFPAVYYGIGLVYYKLNRFKEALKYLKLVDDILEKGIHCKVYTWPGLSKIIKETKSDDLKNLIESMIKDCESPPPPDATCRFEDCNSHPKIYYNDPDFKGFHTLLCSDHCCLQYHPQCWKILKTLKNLTDKEFLEKLCLTPDCNGTIIKVESINKEGITEREFGMSQPKKSTKQKKTKMTKKLDTKEYRKQKRQISRDLEMGKHRTLTDNSPTPPIEMNGDEPNGTTPDLDVEMDTNESTCNEKQKSENIPILNSSLSVNAEPFIVIKKEKINSENFIKTPSKTKEPKKNKAISLQEFCNHVQIPNYLNTYSNEFPSLPQKNECLLQDEWQPYNELHEASNSVNSNAAINGQNASNFSQGSDYQDAFLETNDLEAIKNNLYNYMEDFLIRNGPLSIKDSRLVSELEMFPTEANIVIAKSGGIGEFLKSDTEYRFGIVDDLFICSREDLADAYKLSRSSGVVGADNTDLLEDFEIDNLNNKEMCDNSPLNPDAKEYTPPSNCSSTSMNSFSSTVEESFDIKMEKINHNSPTLLNAICKLRQPLSVDDNSTERYNEATGSSPPTSMQNCIQSVSPHPVEEVLSKKEVIKTSPEKCIEAIRAYFKDDMEQYRFYIDSCIKPFGIAYIPKKSSKLLQTDQVMTESKSTMKTDDQLNGLTELVDVLTVERRELAVQKTIIETKFVTEMESSTKYRKKTAVEMACLKKELEDSKLLAESQQNNFKNQEMKYDREHKLLVESLNKTMEENSQQKKELDRICVNNESVMVSLRKVEDSLEDLRTENKLLKKSLDHQAEKLVETVQNNDAEKLKLTARAKKAELQLLEFTKQIYLKKIDNQTVEAAKKMQEIKAFLPAVGGSNVLFQKNFQVLIIEIQKHISKLAEIRLDFQVRIDEQINAVNNGTLLGTLNPVELKNLPEIPSFTVTAPTTATAVNNQPPSWNFSAFNSMNPGSQVLNSFNVEHNLNPSMGTPMQPKTAPQYGKKASNNAQALNTASAGVTNPSPPPGITNMNKTPIETAHAPVNIQATSMKQKVPNVTETAKVSETSAISKKPQGASASKLQERQTTVINTKIPTGAQTKSSSVVSDLNAISKDPSMSSSFSVGAERSEKICVISSLELGYIVNKNKSELNSSSTSLSSVKSTNKASAAKSSYMKLIQKLKSRYPEYDDMQLMFFIKEVRKQRPNGFSGLPIDTILSSISAFIDLQKQPKPQTKGEVTTKDRTIQNKTLVNKKLTSEEKIVENVPSQKQCPWGINDTSKNQWSATSLEECSICCEEMSLSNAYRVDCGHCFHLNCIKGWLNTKSNCPICRVHLLLPEDYPVLP